jgi:hypothetical protein
MQILNNSRYRVIEALSVSATGIFLLLLCGILSGMMAVPQSGISREYQVKAVFLYNFCHFVEWPEKAFANPDDPLIIGILGDNPFDNYLEETIKGEEANGHSLVVKHFQNVNQISTCHVLFINVNGKDEVKKVLAALENRSILTVSETANFAKQGGVIRFFTEDNRTRIRINLDAAKKAELTINSKLLKVSDVVTSQTN